MLSISRTDLPAYLIEKLRVCGYKNANDIVTTSPLLMMSQDFNHAELQLISTAISKKLTPKYKWRAIRIPEPGRLHGHWPHEQVCEESLEATIIE